MASNNFGASADYRINRHTYRYLDVETRETAEYNPLARVYLTEENPNRAIPNVSTASKFIQQNYINPFDIPHGCRILKSPIEDLRELQVTLKLKGGINAPNITDIGVDLTFEIYSLEQAPKVPHWVDQKFTF